MEEDDDDVMGGIITLFYDIGTKERGMMEMHCFDTRLLFYGLFYELHARYATLLIWWKYFG
jgi:hypothetical protein